MSDQGSGPDELTWHETWDRIKEDFRACCKGSALHLRALATLMFALRFQVLTLYRLGHWTAARGGPSRFANPLLAWLLQTLSGCHIDFGAKIGRRCRLPHCTGIVIGAGVTIDDDVTIYQNVSLGSHGRPGEPQGYPRIGSRTTLYTGAVVIGAVTVGSECIIGANSVVTSGVPPRYVAVGAPARVYPRKPTTDSPCCADTSPSP